MEILSTGSDSLQRYDTAKRWLAEVQASSSRYESPEWLACIVELGEARRGVDDREFQDRQVSTQQVAAPPNRAHPDYTLPDTFLNDTYES